MTVTDAYLNRRNFLKIMGLGTALLWHGHPARVHGLEGRATKKPNIIFILIDDMGWMDVGCYGSKYYETPNIDKLAKQSILFTDA